LGWRLREGPEAVGQNTRRRSGSRAFVLLRGDGLERRADAHVLRAVAAVTHRPPVIAAPPERWKLVHPVAAFWALLTTIERVLHGPSSSVSSS
jgi:hypothetical protein